MCVDPCGPSTHRRFGAAFHSTRERENAYDAGHGQTVYMRGLLQDSTGLGGAGGPLTVFRSSAASQAGSRLTAWEAARPSDAPPRSSGTPSTKWQPMGESLAAACGGQPQARLGLHLGAPEPPGPGGLRPKRPTRRASCCGAASARAPGLLPPAWRAALLRRRRPSRSRISPRPELARRSTECEIKRNWSPPPLGGSQRWVSFPLVDVDQALRPPPPLDAASTFPLQPRRARRGGGGNERDLGREAIATRPGVLTTVPSSGRRAARAGRPPSFPTRPFLPPPVLKPPLH